MILKAWLKFFRVVNLPTVPGDVLVGVAAAVCGVARAGGAASVSALSVVAACAAGVFLYAFGLADNDIVGASVDTGRPIPDGEISLGAARLARGLCLFAALVAGAAVDLPPAWWVTAFALAVAVVVYNRTKSCVLMGLCRGLNVACGGAVALASCASLSVLVCAAVWTLYITVVTMYSLGEETDPARKRRVGFLIGGIVYLQLAALLFFAVKPLLIAGGVLLIVLRTMRRLLPKVSAS